MPYDRARAVTYAHRYAMHPNPEYFYYGGLGGDCTNFCSQCLHAGGAPMSFEKTFGWYYRNGNDKAPAWTGVRYLYNFLTTNQKTGPFGREAALHELEAGDLVQLSFDGETYSHTLFVVQTGAARPSGDILVAAHSLDSDNRPLASYGYAAARGLRIDGVRP